MTPASASKWLDHSEEVPRLSGITPSQLDDLLTTGPGGFGIPFIATDAMQDWYCMKTWSFDWLRQHYGDVVVRTAASIESPIHMQGCLADYIDYITAPADPRRQVPRNFIFIDADRRRPVNPPAALSDSPQYLVSWDLEDVEPITHHFHQPYFMEGRNLLDNMLPATRRGLFNKHTWIFMGPHYSLSQLHNDHDHVHSYLAQVIGRKKVILYSPHDAGLVAQVDRDGFTQDASGVDPRAPDLIRFPRFHDARPYECILEPGDLLFLPASWLHCAYGLSAGISVSKDSVDRFNFGRWFQSMAITNLPKLASRVMQHESFMAAPPAWAIDLQNCPVVRRSLSRYYRRR